MFLLVSILECMQVSLFGQLGWSACLEEHKPESRKNRQILAQNSKLSRMAFAFSVNGGIPVSIHVLLHGCIHIHIAHCSSFCHENDEDEDKDEY